jgi:PleD family two-component response regulator
VIPLILASDDATDAAIISTLPALIAVILVATFVVGNWNRFGALVHRISSVKVAGIELDLLATTTLKKARPDHPVTSEAAAHLAQRISLIANLLEQSRILWVDDKPAGNRGERTYLRVAGATVVNALSTDEALKELARDDFTLVITDMQRTESSTLVSDAGIKLVKEMRARGFQQPIIGYVYKTCALPPGWSGITAKPDELINLVLDVVEQSKLNLD